MSTAANPVLVHWQWFDGSTGSTVDNTTSFASEDTTYEFTAASDNAHLRVKIGNTGDMSTNPAWTLQYDTDSGFSSPTTITAASSDWQVGAGTGTDGDAVSTERLTTTARTFSSGVYEEGDGSASVVLAGGADTEIVWCIAPQSAAAGNTYYFRVLFDGATIGTEGTPGTITSSVATASAPPVDVAVGQGTAAVTGYAPSPIVDVVVGVPTGTVSATGQIPTISTAAGVTVDVPQGTASVSTFVPLPWQSGIQSNPDPPPSITIYRQGRVFSNRYEEHAFLPKSVSVDAPQGTATATGYEPTIDITGANVSVAVPQGSVTVAGQAPNSILDVVVGVPQGTVTATGYEPTANTVEVVNVAVPQGTATATGYAPDPILDVVVGVPQGTITPTGYAPDPILDVVIGVPQGSAAAAGQEPSVSTAEVIDVAVPQGTITATRYAPDPILDVVVGVPQGTITSTGYAPDPILDVVVGVPQGSITTAGQEPTATVGVGLVSIEIPDGAISAAGYAPSVDGGAAAPSAIAGPIASSIYRQGRIYSNRYQQHKFSPAENLNYPAGGPGAVTAAGQVPTVVVSGQISVPQGSAAAAGYAPSLLFSPTVIPDAGAVSAAGQVPTALLGAASPTVAVDEGSIAAAGYAPNVVLDIDAYPDSGAATATGFSPAVALDQLPEVPAGSASASGYAPAITTGYTASVPQGAVSVTGYEPTDLSSSTTIAVPAGQVSITGLRPVDFGLLLVNPQPVAFNRGSRVLPFQFDDKFIPSPVTGTGAVQAGDASTTGIGGFVIDGSGAVQARPAQARGIEAPPPYIPPAPEPIYLYRSGPPRTVVVIDLAVYDPQPDVTQTGTGSAIAGLATVSAAGDRVITGSAAVQAQEASTTGESPLVNGVASANASDATVSATGLVGFTAVVAVQAQAATTTGAGERTINGTGAVTASSAAADGVGFNLGTISGTGDVQASTATITAAGSRGYSTAVAVQAQQAVVVGVGRRIVPNAPEFAQIPTLLSRVYRAIEVEFSDYLNQGDAPITYAIASGELPPGITFDAATGTASGTPTQIGTWTASIAASNITGSDTTNEFTWRIARSIPKDGLTINQNVVTIVGL